MNDNRKMKKNFKKFSLPKIFHRNILSDNQKTKRSVFYQDFQEDYEEIFFYDQLKAQILTKKAFENFQEPKILFPPTYKYDKQSPHFDTSIKKRTPAWTDRIIFSLQSKYQKTMTTTTEKENEIYIKEEDFQIKPEDYYSVDVRSSDHRPVCGVYTLDFKSTKGK